jgi:dethiobiotin synthetase
VRTGGSKTDGDRALGLAPAVFIVGTDTGVGKTLLTGLLLEWLRSVGGVNALAVKPFISGSLRDAKILKRLQADTLGLDDLSPYRYRLPLAPAVASQKEGKQPVHLRSVVGYITRMRRRCDCLLIEGCGGLLSPLGQDFSSLEVIHRVGGHVLIVAQNRLGAINHVMLTFRALETAPMESVRVVLMNGEASSGMVGRTNLAALVERLPCDVSVLPYQGKNASGIGLIRANAKFLEKTLAELLPSDTVTTLLEAAEVRAAVKIEKRVP